MEFSVKLAKQPEGLAFPERLRDRMRFDPIQGRLVYKGFMTKCTYDELSALTDDPDYHRALEQLFVLTSEEVSPHPHRRGLPAAIVLGTIGTIALTGLVLWAMMRGAPADRAPGAAPQNAVSATSR